MKVFLVPEGELVRYAKSTNRAITRDPDSSLSDGIFITDTPLNKKLFLQVADAAKIWHASRDIVCNSAIDVDNDYITNLTGEFYVRYWGHLLKISLGTRIINRISRQIDFIGYDSFIKLLYTCKFRNISTKELAKLPTIWTLYTNIISGDMVAILTIVNDCIKLFGESVVFGSLLTLYERVVSFIESPSSYSASSKVYRDLIEEIANKVSITGIMKSISMLSGDMPTDLKIILSIRQLHSWKEAHPL